MTNPLKAIDNGQLTIDDVLVGVAIDNTQLTMCLVIGPFARNRRLAKASDDLSVTLIEKLPLLSTIRITPTCAARPAFRCQLSIAN
jgi:hypothetical protein